MKRNKPIECGRTNHFGHGEMFTVILNALIWSSQFSVSLVFSEQYMLLRFLLLVSTIQLLKEYVIGIDN